MKVFPSLVMLALSAAVVNAQTSPPAPRTPPATPAPATAPAPAATPLPPTPARAPRAVIMSPDWDFNFDGLRTIDGERLRQEMDRVRIDTDRIRLDGERMAQEMRARSFDFAREARVSGQYAADEARRAAEALRDMDWGARIAPMAQAAARVGTTIASDIGVNLARSIGDSFASTYSYSPVPQARWDNQQDQDPADSLFKVAYDAMNRGEYRRSADLFAQVQTRFPKSNRIGNSAYNEALMRYKIGSTEELKIALRLLTDRSKFTTASTNFNNEISIMTTRVRGALASRGDSEQARLLREDAQKGGCDREEMQVRAEALSALAQSDQNAATPMLRRVLEKKDPCSLELRRRALSILLRRQDTAATSAAIAVARNADETLELRVDAVQYLSRLPGENALSTLEDLMRNSPEREVQRAAVRSLSNSENSRARSTVRAIIERADASEELRREALMSFSKDRSSADDATYLRNLFSRMQSEQLKRSVLAAIARLSTSEGDQFLLSVARNNGESNDVRSEAISRLARSSATISVADLSKLYDAAESRSLRLQSVNALSQRKEPEALDKLIDILKNSTDSSVRSSVLNILSRNQDPKAKAAIAEFAAGRP